MSTSSPPSPWATAPRQPVGWRRLRHPVTLLCLAGSAVAAVGLALGALISGRLAETPSLSLVALLAACIVGGAIVDTGARAVWSGVVDRAEGRLRSDLIDAAMSQPLADLSEQAVGEVLDRVDDDTHEVGVLLRQHVWDAFRTLFATVPLWLVSGLTWWPAFLLLPLSAGLCWLLVRRLLPKISQLTVAEEAAWTDHAAALEEGVAGRDDLRTSLGQAHVVRRCTELAAEVHRRFDRLLSAQVRVGLRTGLLLHGLLAGLALAGVALAGQGRLTPADLVTLFVATSMFVGQVDQLMRHLPDLQAGFGAVLRLRDMMASPAEPSGGRATPPHGLSVEFCDLDFRYAEGSFALSGVSLLVPSGQTCALMGRTGSGKSTLAGLVSRAVEPAPGTIFLGGVDVTELNLQQLRASVGVVTQRTEILAGTVAENIALFAPIDHATIAQALDDLGLTPWLGSLSAGLDTPLGPGGRTLSAGEEQLIAFARLLVRDPQIVILDEATARMDPVTEQRVVQASQRLLEGRTGLLVAHRLSTTERADLVAVLEGGRLIQHGPRAELARTDGPYQQLLVAAHQGQAEPQLVGAGAAARSATPVEDGTALRRAEEPLPERRRQGLPTLTRAVWRALCVRPRWGLFPALLFGLAGFTGAFGSVTGWLWGQVITRLQTGTLPLWAPVALTLSILAAPLLVTAAMRRYPRWWVDVMLRVRARVLAGQIDGHRLARTPPGEVVSRAMDSDRLAQYCDRWVDLVNGILVVILTGLIAQSWGAAGILTAVLIVSALASSLGRGPAGRSAAIASERRARFGRSLVSALDSIRTVKLAAATDDVHRHLRQVDSGRVTAAIREHRIQALLNGVPVVMVQLGVVAAWLGLASGRWGLATTLLVANAVAGFDWFGKVAGSVVTEAPGTRAWLHATSAFAGGGSDISTLAPGVDLVTGSAPAPEPGVREPLHTLTLRELTVVHDDGTVGVRGIDLTVHAGELVLVLGRVAAGKSSLLSALAGLTHHRGDVLWNGRVIGDAEAELRPGRVAHVAQLPRVFSGSFADNIALDHRDREVAPALDAARLRPDVTVAGGADALVGHRGVRLSGGQVQRLALARALACRADLLLADDVSSALDAATEIELWHELRRLGATVIGSSNKSSALARADRVVVLDQGYLVDQGPWSTLSARWGHLAG